MLLASISTEELQRELERREAISAQQLKINKLQEELEEAMRLLHFLEQGNYPPDRPKDKLLPRKKWYYIAYCSNCDKEYTYCECYHI